MSVPLQRGYMKQTHQASITISKDNRDNVRLSIRDEASRTTFVECSITLENYAKIITGLSEVKCDATYKNLHNVGKQKVIKQHEIVYNGDKRNPSSEDFSKWLVENVEIYGDTELQFTKNSRDSVVLKDGKYILRYSIIIYEG